MTTLPLDNVERAVAVAPMSKCFQSCAWQGQPQPRPPGWTHRARAALATQTGAGDCFEILRQNQFMGPPFKNSSSENAKSAAGLKHFIILLHWKFHFGCSSFRNGDKSQGLLYHKVCKR